MRSHLVLLSAALALVIAGCASQDDDDDSAVGDDDDDASGVEDLVGLTYFLDIPGGGFVFTEPPDVGTVFVTMYPSDTGNIFSVTALDEAAGTVDLRIGSGWQISTDPEVWEQGTLPTTDASGSWDGLTFVVGPTDLVFEFDLSPSWLWDVTLGGTFSADGSEVVDTHFEATVDLVPYDVYMELDPGSLCELLEDGTDAECVDCPPEGPNQGAYCIHLVASGGTSPLLEGVSMVEVD
jgi:hypothetical protein